MKIHLLAYLTLGLASVAIARADYSFKEPFTKSSPFHASGEISLENVNGNVEIRTWNKNEILIEGEKSAKTEEELKLVDLTMDMSESAVDIKVKLPKRPGGMFSGNGNIRAAVKFTLTVPADAVLKNISTVNSSVVVDGVRGSVRLSTVNGGIRANSVGGEGHFRTVNGSIHVASAALGAGQKLFCESVNGGITVTLPKDSGFELHTSVVNGHVDCDFPIGLGKKAHGKSISGKVGDGRGSVEARTVNGGVNIESV
jgi:DUF4097 and DUF4098 domain-containing protein YvlB